MDNQTKSGQNESNEDIDNKILNIGEIVNQNEKNEEKKVDDEEEEEEEKITIKRNLDENVAYERSIKVIILGDSNVGKSSFINRIKNKEFREMTATLSVECHSYIISCNNYIIRMQIWDTAGQEKFNSIVRNYYKGTEVGIFLYSIDMESSFNNVKTWYQNLKDNSKINSVNILIGNKKDLDESKRKVTNKQGEQFAEENGFYLFREISCKDNDKLELENILEIFDELGKYFYSFYRKRSGSVEDLNYKASDSMIALGMKQRDKEEKKSKCCG